MKNYTIYACEECKFETRNLQEMREHEAAHLGLTVEQHDEYKKLKQDAASAGALIAMTKNEQTEEMFDNAIRALVKFEKEHLRKNIFDCSDVFEKLDERMKNLKKIEESDECTPVEILSSSFRAELS